MEGLIDYIVENYVVFLIILGVIVMVIIGYLADKTDFWRNKKGKSKTESVEQNGPSKEDLDKLKNMKLNDAVTPNSGNTSNQVVEPISTVNEDLNVPLNLNTTNINNNLNAPLESANSNIGNLNEDLNAPFGDSILKTTTPVSTPSENPMVTLNEDLNVPFGNQDTKVKEVDAFSEMPSLDEVSSLNELNEMPSVEQTSVVESEENKQTEEIMPNFDTISDIEEEITPVETDEIKPVESEIVTATEPLSETMGNLYDEPIVPEFIAEQLIHGDDKSVVLSTETEYELDKQTPKEEDMWKF